MNKASFKIQLSGFTPANRDAEVELRNVATGATVRRKPFLDGSLFVRDLEPGPYEIEVRHPNLLQPIDRRNIRLLPHPFPTRVAIPVPEHLFRDTPIRDVPDADLTPVQQTAGAVREEIAPLGGKAAGEVIRADDWNRMVQAVTDLSTAVLELTRLVSPRGHAHPEIAEKIDEVQGNLRRFADAFGRSLLELRREFEAEKLRRQVDVVLDRGGAGDAIRDRLRDRLDDLRGSLQANPTVFTAKLSNLGSAIAEAVDTLAEEQDDTVAFLEAEEVRTLSESALQYATTGRQSRAEGELNVYRRSASKTGGRLLPFVLER